MSEILNHTPCVSRIRIVTSCEERIRTYNASEPHFWWVTFLTHNITWDTTAKAQTPLSLQLQCLKSPSILPLLPHGYGMSWVSIQCPELALFAPGRQSSLFHSSMRGVLPFVLLQRGQFAWHHGLGLETFTFDTHTCQPPGNRLEWKKTSKSPASHTVCISTSVNCSRSKTGVK